MAAVRRSEAEPVNSAITIKKTTSGDILPAWTLPKGRSAETPPKAIFAFDWGGTLETVVPFHSLSAAFDMSALERGGLSYPDFLKRLAAMTPSDTAGINSIVREITPLVKPLLVLEKTKERLTQEYFRRGEPIPRDLQLERNFNREDAQGIDEQINETIKNSIIARYRIAQLQLEGVKIAITSQDVFKAIDRDYLPCLVALGIRPDLVVQRRSCAEVELYQSEHKEPVATVFVNYAVNDGDKGLVTSVDRKGSDIIPEDMPKIAHDQEVGVQDGLHSKNALLAAAMDYYGYDCGSRDDRRKVLFFDDFSGFTRAAQSCGFSTCLVSQKDGLTAQKDLLDSVTLPRLRQLSAPATPLPPSVVSAGTSFPPPPPPMASPAVSFPPPPPPPPPPPATLADKVRGFVSDISKTGILCGPYSEDSTQFSWFLKDDNLTVNYPHGVSETYLPIPKLKPQQWQAYAPVGDGTYVACAGKAIVMDQLVELVQSLSASRAAPAMSGAGGDVMSSVLPSSLSSPPVAAAAAAMPLSVKFPEGTTADTIDKTFDFTGWERTEETNRETTTKQDLPCVKYVRGNTSILLFNNGALRCFIQDGETGNMLSSTKNCVALMTSWISRRNGQIPAQRSAVDVAASEPPLPPAPPPAPSPIPHSAASVEAREVVRSPYPENSEADKVFRGLSFEGWKEEDRQHKGVEGKLYRKDSIAILLLENGSIVVNDLTKPQGKKGMPTSERTTSDIVDDIIGFCSRRGVTITKQTPARAK